MVAILVTGGGSRGGGFGGGGGGSSGGRDSYNPAPRDNYRQPDNYRGGGGSSSSGSGGDNSARVLVDYGVPLALAADAEKLASQLSNYGVDVNFHRSSQVGSKRGASEMDRGADRDRDRGYGDYNNRDRRPGPGNDYNSNANTRMPRDRDRDRDRREPAFAPRPDSDQKLEFLVPSDRVGSVLGVGGKNCKDLQYEYQVHIHIEKDETPNPGYRKVIVSGNDISQVVKARERILQMVDDAGKHGGGPPDRQGHNQGQGGNMYGQNPHGGGY